MTHKQHNAKEAVDWKEIFRSDGDGMRALIQQVVQDVLEAEMDEAVGAQKGERTESRLAVCGATPDFPARMLSAAETFVSWT